MSKAKVRLTYKPPWYNRVLYTHWSTPPPCYAATHKVALLGHLGITWNQERPKIFLNKSEIRDAKKFLTEHGVTKDNILITIDPTHRRPTRRWPTKHYAKLIAMISELRSDVRFLLLCGPGEENVLQTIVQFQNNVKTCILPNKVLSLREMAAIIHQADHHIGNCSAPRHFAVAVGTPSTTILGSTSTKWTYPDPMKHTHIRKGLSCQPCNKDICPKGNIECLNQLKPSEIIDFIMQRLKHKHCYDDTYN
jgi:heptosyltransferase-2/heptosyltransferase-3